MNHDLSQYVLHIHQRSTRLDPHTFNEWLMKSLQEYFSYDSAIWTNLSPEHIPQNLSLWNLDESIVDDYFNIAIHTDEQQRFIDAIDTHRDQVVFADDIVSFDEHIAGDLFKKFYRPRKMIHGLNYTSSSTDLGVCTGLYFNREDYAKTFSEKDRTILNCILPHFITVTRTNIEAYVDRRFSNKRNESAAVCDRSGRIVYAHREFHSLLSEEWPKHTQAKIPPLREFTLHATERTEIFKGKEISLFAQPLGYLYLLHIKRNKFDSLSPRQQEIGLLLYHGLSHKEIARRLDIKLSTVDNTVEAIRNKLNIRHGKDIHRYID